MNNADMHAADVATFTERIGHLREMFESHDEQCARSKAEIFARLGKIERLIYIGLGGVIVLGGIVSIIGGNILKILAR